jgi:hypothetical protein
MNYKVAKSLLLKTLEIDKSLAGETNRMTPMMWGGAGVGKSSMVREIAIELGYEIREIRLSTLSPVDVRGVPWVPADNPEHFRFVPPQFMPTGKEVYTEEDLEKGLIFDRKMIGQNRPVMLFFDEINTAPPLNQVVAYEISLDRRMGGHPLPDNTLVVMAGNRVQDRGATFEMPLPLANRLVHIEVEANEDIFFEYGTKKNMPEGMLAFIKFKPQLLNQRPEASSYAFPTPRSWENVARFIKNDATANEVAAIIGNGVAVELFEFLKLKNSLPDLDKILTTGESFKHEELSIMYFYTIAISNRLIKRCKEETNDDNVKSYINNFVKAFEVLSNEMQALAIMCLKTDTKIVLQMTRNRVLFSKISKILN